jgi:hypothetical protein
MTYASNTNMFNMKTLPKGNVEFGNYIEMSLHSHPLTVIDKNFGHVKLTPLFSKLDVNGKLRICDIRGWQGT